MQPFSGPNGQSHHCHLDQLLGKTHVVSRIRKVLKCRRSPSKHIITLNWPQARKPELHPGHSGIITSFPEKTRLTCCVRRCRDRIVLWDPSLTRKYCPGHRIFIFHLDSSSDRLDQGRCYSLESLGWGSL